MSNTVTHKLTATGNPLVEAVDWNNEHAFTGGGLGAILFRDTGQTDGANWLAAVATGSLLVSGGVGAAPKWSANIGLGTPLGSPTVVPTAVTNGAGVLNGSYQYVYTEKDSSGETTVSSAVTIVATNNTVRVTIGMPRRGVTGQTLYRKNPASSTFNQVHIYSSGYFQNVFDDNVPDATVAGNPAAPSSDTTALYTLETGGQVKYFRTHPNVGDHNVGDVTVLTGNSGIDGGVWAMDLYASMTARTYLGNSFNAFKTGTNNLNFAGFFQDVFDNGVAPVLNFGVGPAGNIWTQYGLAVSSGAYALPVDQFGVSATGRIFTTANVFGTTGVTAANGTQSGTFFLGSDNQCGIRRNNGSGAGTNIAITFDGFNTSPFQFDNVNGLSLTKPVKSINGITATGNGVPIIVASAQSTGNTSAVTNAINYTPANVSRTYELTGVVNVTAWTSPASFTVAVTYKDASGNARTDTALVWRGSTGATAAAVTAVDRWYFHFPAIDVDTSQTAITLSTTGTFTGSPVYNLQGSLRVVR